MPKSPAPLGQADHQSRLKANCVLMTGTNWSCSEKMDENASIAILGECLGSDYPSQR